MSEIFDGLFVLEVANNHGGSLAHGLRIVEMVAELAGRYGIKAGVKLQYRNLDSFIHPAFRHRRDLPHMPRFLATRLTDADLRTLVEAIRRLGLTTICTPFDEDSVDRLLDHGVDVVKVASCSADDWPLLERIAAARKPTIGSTGGRSLMAIDNLVSFMSHREVDFALMHCVSLYPTPPEDVQLGFMTRLMRRFPELRIGYSGHEASDNLEVVKSAVAMGAVILERHVGIPTDAAPLNAYSMNPQQTAQWIENALATRTMMGAAGDAPKRITDAEHASLRSLTRGTYASRALRKGETLHREDVFFAMPCDVDQTTSGEYQDTMVALRDYAAMDAIRERRAPNLIGDLRTIIHDAKGLLSEAHVHVGSEFSIELSHHYGIERFREVGALLLTLVNREYCKRVVVMLPGQRHPLHFHKQKEETFHVLWGDLELTLEDRVMPLTYGAQVLIPRGAAHAFSSRGGCVFEELSTRHVVGDSFYDDAQVRSVDPIQRKTIIEGW